MDAPSMPFSILKPLLQGCVNTSENSYLSCFCQGTGLTFEHEEIKTTVNISIIILQLYFLKYNYKSTYNKLQYFLIYFNLVIIVILFYCYYSFFSIAEQDIAYETTKVLASPTNKHFKHLKIKHNFFSEILQLNSPPNHEALLCSVPTFLFLQEVNS